MSSITYDYAIVGAGAAGFNLALAMSGDPFFNDKNILIVEKEDKLVNDRTWSFWERGSGQYDSILHHKWGKAAFITDTEYLDLNLFPYSYKCIRSKEFYAYAKNELFQRKNIAWVKDEIIEIKGSLPCKLKGINTDYACQHVFDSRIDEDFKKSQIKYVNVWQHFKGWFISADEAVFDPKIFTMMDFRIKYKNTTSFTYILPTTTNKALVEFTFFSPDLIKEEEYEYHIRKYISDVLKIRIFDIEEVEKGIIPMSNYPFHKDHSEHLTKIGTAGGWVRPSSGYSFRNAQVNAQKLVENLKAGGSPAKGIATGRFRKYDTIFLDVLQHNNELGEQIFTSMYKRNSIRTIFRFLDEETSLREDLSIIRNFPQLPFIKALFRQVRRSF